MSGDGENDVKAGKVAGCKTVLLNGDGTSKEEEGVGADILNASLLDFTNYHFV